MKPTLVVMSRSEAARRLFCLLLEREGYRCVGAEDGDAAFLALERCGASAALIDLRTPSDEDLVFMALLRRRRPELGTVVLREGSAQVSYGATERQLAFGGGEGADLSPAFPALCELRRAFEWLTAEHQLARLRTPTAIA